MQIAVRAGGFSALVVVGMAVIGIAILYSTFYVWLGVDSPGGMNVTDCKSSAFHRKCIPFHLGYIIDTSSYCFKR